MANPSPGLILREYPWHTCKVLLTDASHTNMRTAVKLWYFEKKKEQHFLCLDLLNKTGTTN